MEFALFQTFRKLLKNDFKLVPTLKPTRMFDLKFRMQGLTREGDGYVMLGYFNKVQSMLPIKLGTFEKKVSLIRHTYTTKTKYVPPY